MLRLNSSNKFIFVTFKTAAPNVVDLEYVKLDVKNLDNITITYLDEKRHIVDVMTVIITFDRV